MDDGWKGSKVKKSLQILLLASVQKTRIDIEFHNLSEEDIQNERKNCNTVDEPKKTVKIVC